MSLGKVTEWKMTEEQRLEYIKKNPIRPTAKPKEAKFSHEAAEYQVALERRREALKGKKLIDHIDKDKLHKLFISGMTLVNIAKALSISDAAISNIIKELRRKEPEKWPRRR